MVNKLWYRIWSIEHVAWWRAKSVGYTLDVFWAGRYTPDETRDIVQRARGQEVGIPFDVGQPIVVYEP
jgi:hypothetical protein